jgi:competence protein ComEA
MRLLKILFLMLSFISYGVYADTPQQVNVNTATAMEIKQVLSGIGDKKAQAIIEYREQHGVFNSVYDLTLVHGIGNKTVEKNLDRIILSEPKPEETPPVETEENLTQEQTTTPAETTETLPKESVTQESVTQEVKTKQQLDVDPDFSDTQITPESLKQKLPTDKPQETVKPETE